MPKKPVTNPSLKTWVNLNKAVTKINSEADCRKLLAEEESGRNRYQFLMRIHSRLNYLRRAKERKELAQKAGR